MSGLDCRWFGWTRRVFVIILVFWGACPATAQVIGSSPEPFRTIELNSFRDLPRLGVQDTQGYVPFPMDRQTSQQTIRANIDDAMRIGERIERHGYSVFLLTQLDFLRRHSDCSDGVETYGARVTRCAGQLIEHGGQLEPGIEFTRSLAFALKSVAHAKLFCPGEEACGNTDLNRMTVKTPENRYRPLDEFEKRDVFAQMVANYYGPFRRYYADKELPSHAYWVDRVQLGDYDFTHQQFNIRLSTPRAIGNQRNFAEPYLTKATPVNIKNRQSVLSAQAVELLHQPNNSFETAKGSSGSTSFLRDPVVLAMAPNRARDLVGGNTGPRYVYTVVKIGLEPLRGLGVRHQPLQAKRKLGFYYADNKVEFFEDEGLTRKIGEAPLVAGEFDQSDQALAGYTLKPDSRLFDARVYHLLRFALADLTAPDMDQLAYSLPAQERQFWREHQRRVNDAEAPQPPGTTEEQQSAMALRRQAMKDRARLVNVAWTDRGKWSPAQRQAYYDYLLGYGPQVEPEGSAWPEVLPSTEWGMNLATVFPQGYFSIDDASTGLLADNKTRKAIQAFVRDLAKSQTISHVTGVYPLGDARYDQSTQMLRFERWPLAAVTDPKFMAQPAETLKDPAHLIVHPDAKSRMIYRFIASSEGVGDAVSERSLAHCANSLRRKSYDCGTGWRSVAHLQWYNTFLALDRVIEQPTLILEPSKGLAYARSRRGWRLVVEYQSPEMKRVPFTFTQRNKPEPQEGEAQTIFADVERVLVLSPDDQVVWSQSASELPQAAQVTETVADPADQADYQFPNPVVLGSDSQFQAAAYDFLLAKYYPQQLSERMLDAMMSSRWVYEAGAKDPLGGRFFNVSGRRPGPDEISQNRPGFRTWMLGQAKAFPSQVSLDLWLQYTANSMAVMGRCVKAELVPGAPTRGNTPVILARQKAQQCRTAYDQAVRSHNRCQELGVQLDRAKAQLAETEAEGCDQPAAEVVVPEPASSGADCQISPDVEMSQLAQEMQRCLLEKCGGQPATLGEARQFQACIQTAQAELSSQMQAILGGGGAGGRTKPAKTVSSGSNACQLARTQLKHAEQDYQSARCERHTQTPQEPDCDFESKVVQPDTMPVQRLLVLNDKQCGADQAFYRKQRNAAVLLPGGQPYADTNLALTLEFGDALALPYDSPLAQGAGLRPVKAQVQLRLKGPGEGAIEGAVSLDADVTGVQYVTP